MSARGLQLVLLLLAFSCGAEPAPEPAPEPGVRPDVLLVSIDTLRADALGTELEQLGYLGGEDD